MNAGRWHCKIRTARSAMCGIVGAVGKGEVAGLLLESLASLESPRYNSCGLAMLTELAIEVRKDIGRVQDVAKRWNFTSTQGQVGIAQTRFTSRENLSHENTPPHLSCDQNFALIHNGVIRNYQELRRKLHGLRSHFFYSDTDNEVLAHLIEDAYRPGVSVENAFAGMLCRLKGSFAIAMICRDDPGKLFCARQKSPLILGIDSETIFLASHVNAFLPHTRHIVGLDNGKYAVISSKGYHIRKIPMSEERHRPVSRSASNLIQE